MSQNKSTCVQFLPPQRELSLDLLPHVKFIRTLCTDNHALFYGFFNNMNFNNKIYYNKKKINWKLNFPSFLAYDNS